MTNIKIIGDVHGFVHPYLAKIKDAECSIQLGDFGFAKEWYELEKQNINSSQHKIIPGNHEDYYGIREQYTFGKDFGDVSFNGLDFFFVRGAWSIDHAWRTAGVNWWYQEEIESERLEKAIELYADIKPDVMLTHDCPGDMVDGISSIMFGAMWYPNRTTSALHRMWQIHQPKLWMFGHWHKLMASPIRNTTFVCLDELSVVNYKIDHIGNDIDWNIVQIKEQIDAIKRSRQKDVKW